MQRSYFLVFPKHAAVLFPRLEALKLFLAVRVAGDSAMQATLNFVAFGSF